MTLSGLNPDYQVTEFSKLNILVPGVASLVCRAVLFSLALEGLTVACR